MADTHFLEDVSVEGPAFPLLIKVLASVLMLALLFWGYQAVGNNRNIGTCSFYVCLSYWN